MNKDKDRQIQKEEHYTWYCPKCHTATNIDDWIEELKEKGRQEKEAEMIQEFEDILYSIEFYGDIQGYADEVLGKLKAMQGGDKTE